MDAPELDHINALLDRDAELREKVKEQVNELDKKVRTMSGALNKIHSTRPESMLALLESVRPILSSCQDVTSAIAALIPENQFWRWKDMWSNSIRTAVFSAALVEYLSNHKLLSLAQASEILGIKAEWSDRMALPVEDYLHSLISLVNELSRLAVNSVTLGNFEEPIKISMFVKELFAGFSMLNLKNDTLRRRFDSLKYDIKKIEEGKRGYLLRRYWCLIHLLPISCLSTPFKGAMDSRRRGMPTRPASTEEIQCWAHATQSLRILSSIHTKSNTVDTIGRVNRLISTWPTDDTVPAEGLGGLKSTQGKLTSGLNEITSAAEQEIKAIDDAIERISVLIALRKAPETLPSAEKRKRPRASSPAGTPAPNVSRSVSITLPPRTSSVGPTSSTRDSRTKKDLVSKQQSLQPGRKVAFRPPKSTETEEGTWIVAIVKRVINEKQGIKYEVQDAEPQEDGQPGALYTASPKSIMALPEPDAPPGSPASLSFHPTFPVGSVVLALYPDTSCFYRAEVISTPTPDRSSPSAKLTPIYQVKFEDDDDMIHSVPAHHVVQFPSHLL